MNETQVTDGLEVVPVSINVGVINKDQSEALRKKFPAKLIKKRPGPGGKMFRYVAWADVAERMNEAFSISGWSFTYLAAPKLEGNEVIVGVRLATPVGTFDAYGGHKVLANNPNASYADAVQAATSKALRRAAARLGVGLHLYQNDEEEREAEPSILNAHAAVQSIMELKGLTTKAVAEQLEEHLGYQGNKISRMGEIVGHVMRKGGTSEEEACWIIIDSIRSNIT